MKLTHYTDLGLRLLMYLALRHDETVTIQEVSDRFAISKNHLAKITHQLTKSGLTEGVRGRNGGVRLARLPENISVEDAILASEDNFELAECFGSKNHCVISDVCRLSGVLNAAREAFLAVLRQTTLADLVQNKRALDNAMLPHPLIAILKIQRRIRPSTRPIQGDQIVIIN